jgi:hypothetical protein
VSAIYIWSPIAANNNAAPPNGFPEGMLPADINNSLREVMASVRTWYDDPEFLQLSDAYTVTRTATLTVRVAGVDQTAIYAAGRRIKLTGGALPQYGFVTSSSFTGGNTDVVVVLDGVGVTVDVATNKIYVHMARTARSAAWYSVGTTTGTIPLYENVRLATARQRVSWKKNASNQVITGSPGATSIVGTGGLNYVLVPANATYRLSGFFICEGFTFESGVEYHLQVHVGSLGTSGDGVVYKLPIGNPQVGVDVPIPIVDLPMGALAANQRLSFSHLKTGGSTSGGLRWFGAGTSAVTYCYAMLEESY